MKNEGVQAKSTDDQNIFIASGNAEKASGLMNFLDVRAVRIVAERLQDCYAVGDMHNNTHRHLPDEFDDYVANPNRTVTSLSTPWSRGRAVKPLRSRSGTKQI